MADEVVQAHHIYDQKMKYACNNGKTQKFLATLRFFKRHMDGKAPLRHIKFAAAFSFCKRHMDGVLSENLPDVFCNFFTFWTKRKGFTPHCWMGCKKPIPLVLTSSTQPPNFTHMSYCSLCTCRRRCRSKNTKASMIQRRRPTNNCWTVVD